MDSGQNKIYCNLLLQGRGLSGISYPVSKKADNQTKLTNQMKTIIKTSTSRTEMFNGIAQAVVTATWSDGTQTNEAARDIKYASGKITKW